LYFQNIRFVFSTQSQKYKDIDLVYNFFC